MDAKRMSLSLVFVVCGCANPDATGFAAPSGCENGVFGSVSGNDGSLAELSSDPSVVRARLVEPDLDSIRKGERLELNLFDDVCLKAVREALDARGERSFVWNGRVEGVAESRVILVREDEALFGTIRTPGKFYQVRPLPTGRHASVEVDPSALPPEASPPPTTSVPR
jgi:hypothetical protein